MHAPSAQHRKIEQITLQRIGIRPLSKPAPSQSPWRGFIHPRHPHQARMSWVWAGTNTMPPPQPGTGREPTVAESFSLRGVASCVGPRTGQTESSRL